MLLGNAWSVGMEIVPVPDAISKKMTNKWVRIRTMSYTDIPQSHKLIQTDPVALRTLKFYKNML